MIEREREREKEEPRRGPIQKVRMGLDRRRKLTE